MKISLVNAWESLGAEFGPQDSTPIIPNTTWEYNMFVRYPQHDLGVQDAFLASRRFSPHSSMVYQHSYQHIRAYSEHTHQPLTHRQYLDKFENTIHT